MAEQIPVVELQDQAVQDAPAKKNICGGLTDGHDLQDEDKALFEEYRDVIQEKLCSELQVAKDFQVQPVKVRTQIVAGTNYFFQVNLPDNEIAEVKIFKPLPKHKLQSLDRPSRVTITKVADQK